MMDKKIVINYHITEKCNYICKHCFAEYGLDSRFKAEIHHDLEQVEKMLSLVYQYFTSLGYQSVRINFAGGEPLIVKKISDIIKLAFNIGFEVSLISNGSALTEHFIKVTAPYLSVLGLSIDSFHSDTNLDIGRVTKSGSVNNFYKLAQKINLFRMLNPAISIKINTVVSDINYTESMSDNINQIAPNKWKIFEVIPNKKEIGAITRDQFEYFISHHKNMVKTSIFVEYKSDLINSYIMIDPLGRFYQRQSIQLANVFSTPIIKIGADSALKQVGFNQHKFDKRYIPLVEAA